MSQHVDRGITITYMDGLADDLYDCRRWWTGEDVLHTNTVVGDRVLRGPSFPLVNIRKWEAIR